MCQVLDGDLPIQIKWFKDQSELLDSTSGSSSQAQKSTSELEVELLSNDELGSSLLFRKVQQKHSGNYTCLAKNHHGSTSYSSSLSVKSESLHENTPTRLASRRVESSGCSQQSGMHN